MILGSYVKRAQTISFVERGFEGLGLGYWSVDNHSVHTKVSHARFEESFSLRRSGRLWFLTFFPSPLWNFMLGHYNRLLEMMGGLSQPTACANTQALPIDSANCRDSIRDDPKIILGSYVKGPNNIICKAWV